MVTSFRMGPDYSLALWLTDKGYEIREVEGGRTTRYSLSSERNAYGTFCALVQYKLPFEAERDTLGDLVSVPPVVRVDLSKASEEELSAAKQAISAEMMRRVIADSDD